MIGLMISTIEAIVWLSLGLFALMVRIGIGVLSLIVSAVRWVIDRNRRQPHEHLNERN